MNPKVDTFIEKTDAWKAELILLRSILLDCQLGEEFKWRNPCYTYNDSNIIILGRFKDYCAFSFFKGVLLNDAEKLLVSPGENSQSVKLFKFKSVAEIIQLEPIIRAYIFEAIEIEKAGLKVSLAKSSDLELVEEFQEILSKNVELKSAFEALTPGRQRAYNMFISAAKQSKTRISRVEQYTPRILSGKGMNDCVCGMSKRMPNCDGSHKYL